jgi:hypothetical protein
MPSFKCLSHIPCQTHIHRFLDMDSESHLPFRTSDRFMAFSSSSYPNLLFIDRGIHIE